jgi:hypothetical protein
MTSAVVANRTEYSDVSAVTSITPTFTQTTGDMVVIFIAIADVVTISSISDGFTLLTSGSLNFHILYKLALDGSEGGNVNFTMSAGNKVAAIAYNIQGHSTTQAPEKSTVATGSGSTIDPTTVTPTGGAKDYLWIAAARSAGEAADTDTVMTSDPTNFGNRTQKTTGTAGVVASNTCLGCADYASNASSMDPSSFGWNIGVAWSADTLAIHPAQAGPAGVKTFNGLAKASVKTVDGLALASVKSVEGLA